MKEIKLKNKPELLQVYLFSLFTNGPGAETPAGVVSGEGSITSLSLQSRMGNLVEAGKNNLIPLTGIIQSSCLGCLYCLRGNMRQSHTF